MPERSCLAACAPRVAHHLPTWLPLPAENAAACCEACLQTGRLRGAVDTAKAVLRLQSRLRFGSRASAEPYAAVGVRCKQALKAAYDAGADIRQEVRTSGGGWLRCGGRLLRSGGACLQGGHLTQPACPPLSPPSCRTLWSCRPPARPPTRCCG